MLTSLCRYDAIVFDFDGTLIDSAPIKTEAFGKLYESYGEKIVHEVIAWHKQHEGISRFVKFRYWHENLLNKPYTEEVGLALSRNFSRLVMDEIVKAPYVAGAGYFLEKYYQKLPLFIASGTPIIELNEIIDRRNMQPYFKGVYGSPTSKENILKKILIDNKWSPKRILMVGDAISDWEGAVAVGADFFGIQVNESGSLPKGCVSSKNLENLDYYL
ncbi:MAG: HAD family hydrolase [Gammaproteobacteria bacterium]|nr:HAD family hydrolase [Gammaproteobacteria bacterium]